MKVNVQSVRNTLKRNTLHQKEVIHSLTCDKDRIFSFPGIIFSSKISYLCFYPHFRQTLVITARADVLFTRRQCHHLD